MGVCRLNRNRNFTHMSNIHLRDKNLSNKARGLLSTMLSLPDDWDYTTRGLAAICKDGVDGITAQLKELEQRGYLIRTRKRDAHGRIVDVIYDIFEEPQIPLSEAETPYTEKPDTVMPGMVEPRLGTPAQRNIDKRSTEEINTHIRNIDSIPSGGYRPSVLAALDEKRGETEYRDIERYRDLIMDNIEYDILLENNPYDREQLAEILELLVDTVCSTKKYIRVAGSDYPAEVVRSRLLKLNAHHIEFVISCFKENTTKVRNVKQYLLTSLYNAPVTIDSYYTALVQHDLYGSPRE